VRPLSQHATFDAAPPRTGLGLRRRECERVVDLAEATRGRRATVARRRSSRAVEYQPVQDVRSATVFELAFGEETAWIYERIHRIAADANRRLWQFDLSGIFHPIKVIRYEAGDHYTWHTDLGGGAASDRKLSMTVQLSAPGSYDGGDLELIAGPHPVTAPRERGAAIVFPSYLLHRVTPVARGLRFALVTWVQGPPFR